MQNSFYKLVALVALCSVLSVLYFGFSINFIVVKESIYESMEKRYGYKISSSDVKLFVSYFPEIKFSNAFIYDNRKEKVITAKEICIRYNIFTFIASVFSKQENKVIITDGSLYLNSVVKEPPPIRNVELHNVKLIYTSSDKFPDITIFNGYQNAYSLRYEGQAHIKADNSNHDFSLIWSDKELDMDFSNVKINLKKHSKDNLMELIVLNKNEEMMKYLFKFENSNDEVSINLTKINSKSHEYLYREWENFLHVNFKEHTILSNLSIPIDMPNNVNLEEIYKNRDWVQLLNNLISNGILMMDMKTNLDLQLIDEKVGDTLSINMLADSNSGAYSAFFDSKNVNINSGGYGFEDADGIGIAFMSSNITYKADNITSTSSVSIFPSFLYLSNVTNDDKNTNNLRTHIVMHQGWGGEAEWLIVHSLDKLVFSLKNNILSNFLSCSYLTDYDISGETFNQKCQYLHFLRNIKDEVHFYLIADKTMSQQLEDNGVLLHVILERDNISGEFSQLNENREFLSTMNFAVSVVNYRPNFTLNGRVKYINLNFFSSALSEFLADVTNYQKLPPEIIAISKDMDSDEVIHFMNVGFFDHQVDVECDSVTGWFLGDKKINNLMVQSQNDEGIITIRNLHGDFDNGNFDMQANISLYKDLPRYEVAFGISNIDPGVISRFLLDNNIVIDGFTSINGLLKTEGIYKSSFYHNLSGQVMMQGKAISIYNLDILSFIKYVNNSTVENFDKDKAAQTLNQNKTYFENTNCTLEIDNGIGTIDNGVISTNGISGSYALTWALLEKILKLQWRFSFINRNEKQVYLPIEIEGKIPVFSISYDFSNFLPTPTK
ncbi:AsmA-like C-terminal region-containing protein [Candidatus Fokinia crypta]|uniref:AsmA domain protein n=1 Tax=Candidatus Fokinia crypta TaxID=1920990 RepID=A0ABZ0UNW7_9RICK|nr:AsmA-like C-terminal region-containing protein [Candidatus Fokinia cryptica]WPX97806.1 Putative asmA domain protein [Candidatus Fokinia cryptica]